MLVTIRREGTKSQALPRYDADWMTAKQIAPLLHLTLPSTFRSSRWDVQVLEGVESSSWHSHWPRVGPFHTDWDWWVRALLVDGMGFQSRPHGASGSPISGGTGWWGLPSLQGLILTSYFRYAVAAPLSPRLQPFVVWHTRLSSGTCRLGLRWQAGPCHPWATQWHCLWKAPHGEAFVWHVSFLRCVWQLPHVFLPDMGLWKTHI
jgi:hypothetical protein